MTFYRVLESFRFQFHPEFTVKLQCFPDKTQNNARLFLFHFLLKELHSIGLGLLCNVYVGFYGFVIGVTGPFHHHVRCNIHRIAVYVRPSGRSFSVWKDTAGSDEAHQEVGVVGRGDGDTLGNGGVDESETASLQVHLADDSDVADVADVVSGPEKYQIAFLKVGETLDPTGFTELNIRFRSQFVSEMTEYIACEIRTVEHIRPRCTEFVGSSDEGLGIVQDLVAKRLVRIRGYY